MFSQISVADTLSDAASVGKRFYNSLSTKQASFHTCACIQLIASQNWQLLVSLCVHIEVHLLPKRTDLVEALQSVFDSIMPMLPDDVRSETRCCSDRLVQELRHVLKVKEACANSLERLIRESVELSKENAFYRNVLSIQEGVNEALPAPGKLRIFNAESTSH